MVMDDCAMVSGVKGRIVARALGQGLGAGRVLAEEPPVMPG
jgi:hypothetical protein